MHDIIYLCPSTPKGSCCWEGCREEVITHFEDLHRENFLDTNSLDIDISRDNAVNYLMNVMNETYLIQVKYAKASENVEIKIRYLGDESRAAKMFYHIEIMSGNFGFTSKDNGTGFEVVTIRNGAVYVDVQAIKVTCGRRLLDTLVAWIHIENDFNQYAYKSLRRKQYDNKTLESKARESFKRLSSYRTSMRKKSIDGIQTVQTINRIPQERRKSLRAETPDLYHQFVEEIVQEIFRDAMDEIEFKEYELVNLESSSEEYVTNAEATEKSCMETTSRNEQVKNEPAKESFIMDVVEYQSKEEFLQAVRDKIQGFLGDNLVNIYTMNEEDYHTNNSNRIAQYEEIIILKSNKDIDNLKIEIGLPCFQEDVVSSVEVATHQIPDKEYIEDHDRNSVVDVEDLSACQWFLNGRTPDKAKEHEITHRKNRLSQAEELYFNNLNRIRCRNCHIIMIPPIFMCSEGHSVCSTCKSLNCGICGIEITDITNTDLEEISRHVIHPCRFADRGCPEMFSCYEIRRHEVYCDYFRYKCPICCINNGKYYEMKAHIKLLHPSTKIVEECHHPFPRNSDFIFANKYGIFHCTAPLKVNSIEWTVNFCGLETISFVCRVKVTGKKSEKIYTLQRHGNGYKSIIFLDELKSLRLKDKKAVFALFEY